MVQDGKAEAFIAPANPLCPSCLPALESPAVDPGFEWNDVLPRVGFTHTFQTPRRQLVRASWAQYADHLGTGLVGAIQPSSFREIDYPWTDLNQDRVAQANGIDFDNVLWANVDPDNPTATEALNFIDTNLEAPQVEEFILGYEREIAQNFSVGISYVRRERDRELWWPIVDLTTVVPGASTSTYGRLDSSYWVAQPDVPGTVDCYSDASSCYLDGQGGDYSVTPYALTAEGVARTNTARSTIGTNRPGYSEDFDGIEVTAIKRLSNRWMMRGYLAWQDHTANIPPSAIQVPANEVYSLAADGSKIVNFGGEFNQVFYGSSNWSCNVNFLYQLPLNFDVSANLNGRQGYMQPAIQSSNAVDADGRVNLQGLQIDEVDSRRNDDIHLLDLKVSYTLGMSRDGAVAFSLECFNLFNDDTILALQGDQSGAAGRISEVLSPRIFRLGARLTF